MAEEYEIEEEVYIAKNGNCLSLWGHKPVLDRRDTNSFL